MITVSKKTKCVWKKWRGTSLTRTRNLKYAFFAFFSHTQLNITQLHGRKQRLLAN